MAKLFKLVTLAALSSCMPLSVSAATIEAVSGTVVANRGQGFVAAQVNAKVRPGDRVMPRSDSYAVLVYEDGCRVKIEAGELHTVKGNRGSKETEDTEFSPCGSSASTSPVGSSPTAFAIGAAASIAAGAVVHNQLSSGQKPASP